MGVAMFLRFFSLTKLNTFFLVNQAQLINVMSCLYVVGGIIDISHKYTTVNSVTQTKKQR